LAFLSVEKVPRLRRLPVFAFFFREYKRYSPDFNLRIIFFTATISFFKMTDSRQRVAFQSAFIRDKPSRSDFLIRAHPRSSAVSFYVQLFGAS
jgi:hypothetical protein